MLEFRDLKFLTAIAECGSFSAASRKLNVTQPALSAAIKRLETDLKVRLVDRHSRGARLSEEGKFVLQKTYVIIQDMSEIRSVVQHFSEAPMGIVRLGLPTTVAGGLIPELFSRITAQFPLIKLNIIEAMSGALAEMLQMGRIDLAILFDVQPMTGFRSQPLLREKLHLLLPIDHHLANRKAVRLEEIRQLRLVMPSTSHTIRRFVDDVCRSEGYSLDVKADIDSLPGILGLVKLGYCTVMPPFMLKNSLYNTQIKAVEVTRPELVWTLHLASRDDTTRLRANLATSKLLAEVCIEMVEGKVWQGDVCLEKQLP